jgi:hypothetical protein
MGPTEPQSIAEQAINRPNYSINSDGKKRRSFLALLLAAGYAERYTAVIEQHRQPA